MVLKMVYGCGCRRDVFTLDVMSVPQGSGSGFIWDNKGHVVTNYHVIRGASDLRYTLNVFCLPLLVILLQIRYGSKFTFVEVSRL